MIVRKPVYTHSLPISNKTGFITRKSGFLPVPNGPDRQPAEQRRTEDRFDLVSCLKFDIQLIRSIRHAHDRRPGMDGQLGPIAMRDLVSPLCLMCDWEDRHPSKAAAACGRNMCLRRADLAIPLLDCSAESFLQVAAWRERSEVAKKNRSRLTVTWFTKLRHCMLRACIPDSSTLPRAA